MREEEIWKWFWTQFHYLSNGKVFLAVISKTYLSLNVYAFLTSCVP